MDAPTPWADGLRPAWTHESWRDAADGSVWAASLPDDWSEAGPWLGDARHGIVPTAGSVPSDHGARG